MSTSTPDPRLGDPALESYYSDRRLMWRNVGLILCANLGAAVCFTMIGPLMVNQFYRAGVQESGQGLVNSINLWAVSFLVMYFGYKSDHCTSKWGRRIPFLFWSSVMIIITVALFPFFHSKWALIGLWLLQLFFMDMKNSTFPLLQIDCVRREWLARTNALSSVVMSLIGFFVFRYLTRLEDYWHPLPYLLGSAVMLCTATIACLFLREPPIVNPATQPFRPWSTMKIAWRDKRIIVLMLAVATIHGFMVMYGQWLWLYLNQGLGQTRTEAANALSWSILIGAAVAYPVGWITDRFGSYIVVTIFWALQVLMCFLLLKYTTPTGVMWIAMIGSTLGGFYVAADVMVYKSAAVKDVGSMTSTNSFIRNLLVGFAVFGSGLLIESTGNNYGNAFILGACISTLGLILMFVYRHLMKQPSKQSEVAPVPVTNDSTAVAVQP
jgi:MFS family permease